ncbi:sulfite oxidase, putative [Talaromyces stipitatus ATCC 10500]|uniref:Sulfite oxidase, putative n=1 Tax=Talaromyces stipitatus (strain ATCC 10500 / CBS 375.48 / QM 6759 / NRRL 1006) TaxID=441959 RepID=B8MBE3_TALSN|nr:sulfite oxidase, putative [Talaromyces stipitatus ATCC 10500]EED17807.1 sulfite oxidase, putative [Talaromyces stipitatus ATCC 10500]
MTDSTTTTIEHSKEPLNQEPPIQKLVSSFLTKTEATYDRNHGPIPHLNSENHTVTIDGQVTCPLKLSINDLTSEFQQHEVISALQCAGNRRDTMSTQLKEVQGINWQDGAMMNCRWKGPRLRDVLLAAGVDDHVGKEGRFVAFGCYQVECQDDTWFGGSVELERCMSVEDEVILALEMNDVPLTPNHGYPVRVVIPGVAGARWVKWLDRITVQNEHSQNYYQQYDYKALPPEITSSDKAKDYWMKVPPLLDMPINSVVASPDDGETVKLSMDRRVEVKGYAVPQGRCGPVTRVEVSGDGGGTWVEAQLGVPKSKINDKWCWKLWKASVPMERGTGKVLLSRAYDAAGNTQQETSLWNLRGVAYNGYGMSKDLTVE